MGNRAVVVFETAEPGRTAGGGFTSYKSSGLAVYLHWNGGPESVYAFLDAMDRYGVPCDGDYEVVRFLQIAGNFFGGASSLGIFPIGKHDLAIQGKDPGEHGVYVVCRQSQGRRVRRWRGGTKDGRWLTLEQVEAERVAAYAHPYNSTEGDTLAMALDQVNQAFFTEQYHHLLPENAARRTLWELTSTAEDGTKTVQRFNTVQELLKEQVAR